VALSSTEAECGALVVTKEGRWVREFVRELGTEVFRCEDEVLSLTQDNKSAISLTKKVGNHKRRGKRDCHICEDRRHDG